MAVRLWATLPKDHEDNGFLALERPLLDDPEGPFYVVAAVNRKRVTTDDDAAETTPTIRVIHGEACFGADAKIVGELLGRLQVRRCGRPAPTLPFGHGPGDESPDDENPGPDDDDGSEGDGRAKGYDQPDDDQDEDSEPGTSDSPESPRFLSAVE